jgi:hypothetical protein
VNVAYIETAGLFVLEKMEQDYDDLFIGPIQVTQFMERFRCNLFIYSKKKIRFLLY